MSVEATRMGGLPGGLSARSVAAMLLLAVMWGLSIPVTKLGLETMPPLTLTALRFVVAVPLLFLLVVGRQRLPWRAFPSVAALGILGISVGQVAQSFGVQGTSASAGTIISATIPVFVVIFAAFRLKQAVTARQQVGLVAAFAGIALVAIGNGPEGAQAASTSLSGAVWLLLSAVAVAFYYVWSVELTDEFGTTTVAAWSTLVGFLAMLPFAAWEASHTPFHVTAQALWAGAYLGVAVTVAGLFLWLHLLRTVPARVAASVQYLQPVVGILAASLMFGDRLGLFFALGVLLILGGLGLAVATRQAPEMAVPHE
ncbi:DMT family transporter [Enterovirga sp. CN4-39]|uniref:DMT family transporter n=1 Tax=Enterovirga sp. CN4-39 TaxID=3400910 RepID=UPI003C05A9B0